jgi:hypothetical protein
MKMQKKGDCAVNNCPEVGMRSTYRSRADRLRSTFGCHLGILSGKSQL